MSQRATLAILGFLLLLVGFTTTAYSQPPTSEPTLERVQVHSNPIADLMPQRIITGRVARNVIYCRMDRAMLRMDIYYPRWPSLTPAPALLYAHSGGWTQGTRNSGAGIRDIPTLTAHGYLVATADYRLAPAYKFPAQIQDLKCAVRFLRANALKYNIDPDHIGAYGASAGGHLVSLLSTTDTSAGFDVGPYLDQPSRVQAVVDMFGPVDLPKLITRDPGMGQVFGTGAGLALASPINYVTPDDAPVLILQGMLDTQTPPAQSQEFYDLLTATGVPSTLVRVKNAGHAFTKMNNQPISPTRIELSQMIVNFFDQYLH